jgi:hypothetical protein
MLSEPAPALSSIRPGLGDGWDALIARLLAADPGERPASARELLREVIRCPRAPTRPPRSIWAFPIPRAIRWPASSSAAARAGGAARGPRRLAEGAAPVSTLALVGAPGRGTARAVRRRRARARGGGRGRARAGRQFWRGSFDALAAWLRATRRAASRPLDPQRAAEARLAAIAEALEARAARSRCASGWTRTRGRGVRAWAAGAPPSGRVLLVCRRAEAPARRSRGDRARAADGGGRGGADRGAGDVACRRARRRAIAARSQGNAAVVGVLARRLIANLRAGAARTSPTDAGADLDGLLEDGYRALPAGRAGAGAGAGAGATARRAGGDRASAARRAAQRGRAGGRMAGAAADGGVRLPSARTGGRRSPAASRRCGRASRRGRSRTGGDDPRRADALAARDGRRGGARSCGAAGGRRAPTARRRGRRCSTNARRRWRRTRWTRRAPRAGDRPRPARRYEEAARALEAARRVAGDGAPGPRAPSATAGCGRAAATPKGRAPRWSAASPTAPPAAAAELRARLGRCWSPAGAFATRSTPSRRCRAGAAAAAPRRRARSPARPRCWRSRTSASRSARATSLAALGADARSRRAARVSGALLASSRAGGEALGGYRRRTSSRRATATCTRSRASR